MRKSMCMFLAFGFLLCIATGVSAQPGGFGKGQFGKGGFGKGPGTFGKKAQTEEPAIAANATRWEYRVESAVGLGGRGDLVNGLNKLGEEGWELTAIEPSDKGRSAMYYFRRPFTGKPKADAPPKAAVDAAPKEKADAKLELRFYSLKSANAVDVADLINNVLRTNRTDPMRVAADPRTNQVIVNGSPQAQAEIQALIRQLDMPVDTPAPPVGNKKSSKLPGFGK